MESFLKLSFKDKVQVMDLYNDYRRRAEFVLGYQGLTEKSKNDLKKLENEFAEKCKARGIIVNE